MANQTFLILNLFTFSSKGWWIFNLNVQRVTYVQLNVLEFSNVLRNMGVYMSGSQKMEKK